MSDLFLIGRIGTDWVGFPAEQVEAVVPLAEAVPVPHAPPSVRGLVAIRSRLLTLIDTSIVVGSGVTAPGAPMVIITLDGHGYALTLDAVDDVVSLEGTQALAAPLSGRWSGLADAMAEHAERIILIVEPARLVAAAASDLGSGPIMHMAA
ncbi:MAG: chemotaxis protein CheW [Sphingopyxis sp.]